MSKYALVTGSADRIGAAIAIELAKNCFNLLLHYNNSHAGVQKIKSEIEGRGYVAETLRIDFLEDNNFDKIFLDLKKKGIIIEVLVNCASDFKASGFDGAGSSTFQKEMKINFENAYLLTKAFARNFDCGCIINILDTKIEKNHTNKLDYILSKKLLKEFTKLSAVHLAPKFRVNAIAPGLILPPRGKDERYMKKLAQNIPLKTSGNLEQVLKGLRFLLESSFVTGQILYIDGGDHLI